MCSNETSSPSGVGPTAILPYPLSALKSLQDAAGGGGSGGGPLPPPGILPIEQYRLQLYNYAMAERLQRFSPAGPFGGVASPVPSVPGLCPGLGPGYAYGPRLALSMSLFHQRMMQAEEPKPQHSYIGLIAMAILSSPDTKLVLSDIYQYILDNYPYFRTRGPGWRNSIRHNLSLNDCFIKAGRSANGKGHYWAIHPANVDDFKKGDFRRRKAQRKDRGRGHFEGSGSALKSDVRKHMGLAVDEEGNESPSPPPTPASPPLPCATMWTPHQHPRLLAPCPTPLPGLTRKRQFDVASLLAPDDADAHRVVLAAKTPRYASSGEEDVHDEDIDVVSSDAADAQQATTPPMTPVGTPQTPTPWPPQSPTAGPLFMSSVEHHLVSRYYEQLQHSAVRRLALQQQQQQQQQQHQRQTTEIRELTPSPPVREPTPQ